MPTPWLIALDFVAWLIIQPGVAYLCRYVPPAFLIPDRWLYRPRRWERGGAVYQQWFRVKRWKHLLPAGGALFGLFSLRHFSSRQAEYVQTWIQESCRAELTHWLAIPPALIFILWHPWPIVGIMVLYALLVNMPCIIAQRYNRPRLMALLRH